MNPDPFLNLEGRRVIVSVDGQRLKGRLISIRDGFVTLQQDQGPRISLNKFSITSIMEEARPVSRNPRLTRAFWR
jgi:hypothetical protein